MTGPRLVVPVHSTKTAQRISSMMRWAVYTPSCDSRTSKGLLDLVLCHRSFDECMTPAVYRGENAGGTDEESLRGGPHKGGESRALGSGGQRRSAGQEDEPGAHPPFG